MPPSNFSEKCKKCQNGKPLNTGDNEDWIKGNLGNVEFFMQWDQTYKGYWTYFEDNNSNYSFFCPQHSPIKIICKLDNIIL